MISSSPHINLRANRRFRRLALNTVIVLYCLIIAGGVVRSTGSGMGCPDWPRCFGSWVPPTELSQLPANYKEIYGAKLKGEIEFNPIKTWIEYVNRLLGVVTGIMIFCTVLASIHFVKSENKQIFYYSLSAFLLVGVQGWLGAKVVSSELMPFMITLHMLLAIVIVFVLLYLLVWSSFPERIPGLINKATFSRISVVVLCLSLVQIILGTQVRENIDEVTKALGYEARGVWIEQLDIRFYIHRSFSVIIVAVNLFWYYKVKKSFDKNSWLYRIVWYSLVVLAVELITGIVMAYFGVPPFAQPMHLTLGILLIGLQFVSWLLINTDNYLNTVESAVTN